jgi:hypothetical protein
MPSKVSINSPISNIKFQKLYRLYDVSKKWYIHKCKNILLKQTLFVLAIYVHLYIALYISSFSGTMQELSSVLHNVYLSVHRALAALWMVP